MRNGFAAKLGEQVGVDPVKFGMEVFLTRPSGSFTAAEMVGNDIKMFEPAGKKLLIGQYETVDKSRALGMIDEIREAMRAYAAEKGADGIVLCITDIMEEPRPDRGRPALRSFFVHGTASSLGQACPRR